MVVYTLVGSLLMLAAAAATAVLSARGPAELSFAFSDLVANRLPESTQKWIFAAFALAFLIKMPAFPFHGWMPDAYRAMPLPALAVFSGVVSKVAAYGFLRVTLPLFPDAVHDFQTILLVLAAALDPLRLGDGVHADQRAADPRLLLGGAARLHHARPVRRRQRRRGRAGRADAGDPARARGGADAARDRAARRALGRLGGHPRHGRDRVPRARARRAVPDRDAGDAGDAGLGQLRRRVPDPARDVQRPQVFAFIASIGVVLAVGLRAAALHPRDAQPHRAGGHLVRDVAARRARARAARAGDRRLRAQAAGRARRRRAVGQARGGARAAGGRRRSGPRRRCARDRLAQAKAPGDRLGRAVARRGADRRRVPRAAARARPRARSCARAPCRCSRCSRSA